MGIPENIDALLVKHDINQEGLARIADVSPGAVTGWRQGAHPREEALNNILQHFGLQRDDILSDQYGLAAKEHGRILPKGAILPQAATEAAYAPLRGRVHAGDPADEEMIEDMVELPKSVIEGHPRGFFLEVEGDCMSKVYSEYAYVFVDPDKEPQNGSIACFEDENYSAVMRRYYRGANTLILSPDSYNPEYEDIVLGADDIRTIKLVGTVVWFQPRKEME